MFLIKKILSDENSLSKYLSIILGIMSLLSIIGLLINANFNKTEIFSAIINLTQVAIPVIVLIFTIALKKEAITHYDEGRKALVKLQNKYPNYLVGPRYNRDNYDPEKGKGLEYLFLVYNANSKQKAKLVTVQSLKDRALTIHIQKSTLSWALGWGEGDAVKEQDIKELRDNVYNVVANFLDLKFKNDVEIEVIDKSNTIAIFFDYDKISPKRLSKIIFSVTETALLCIQEKRK